MAGNKTEERELFEAVLAGNTTRLQALLERGGDANAEQGFEHRMLEKLGLEYQSHTVHAPLLVAAAGLGRADMVAVLLEHGAVLRKHAHYWAYMHITLDEEQRCSAGNALDAATANGHQDVINLLKAHGA